MNIKLDNNRLTRFESAVFKAPLTKPKVFPGVLQNSVSIQGSMFVQIFKTKCEELVIVIVSFFTYLILDPINCLSDPCHLAWLLKSSNSSQLLNHIQANGICSINGGSPFSALNSFNFSKNCPCSYNY